MEGCIRHLWIFVSEKGYLLDLDILQVIKTAITIIRRYYTFGLKKSPVYFHEHQKYLVYGASLKIAFALVSSEEDIVSTYSRVISEPIYDSAKFSTEFYILNNFSYKLLNNRSDYFEDFNKYLKEVYKNGGKDKKEEILSYYIEGLKQLYKHSVGSDMDIRMVDKFTELLSPHIHKTYHNISYTQEMLGSL